MFTYFLLPYSQTLIEAYKWKSPILKLPLINHYVLSITSNPVRKSSDYSYPSNTEIQLWVITLFLGFMLSLWFYVWGMIKLYPFLLLISGRYVRLIERKSVVNVTAIMSWYIMQFWLTKAFLLSFCPDSMEYLWSHL